jgi:hypothetical protein
MSHAPKITFIKTNIVVLCGGLIALGFGVAIYFQVDSLAEATELIEQKATEGMRLTANLKNSYQLPEQLAAITQARAQVDGRLVSASELAKNLQYFYKLEADTSVKLLSLFQNPIPAPKPGAKPALTGIGYTVSYQGGYAEALNFLSRLESGAHYSRLISANISTNSSAREGPVTVSLALELLGQP